MTSPMARRRHEQKHAQADDASLDRPALSLPEDLRVASATTVRIGDAEEQLCNRGARAKEERRG